jgi:radical SAM superfamily enzyme YgiQ (UPF0313 family)
VLDFPTLKSFREELSTQCYDIVGISSIIVNAGKVAEMCHIVRELAPQAQIVVGGHVTAIPGIESMVDADHIVRGDGISWMRRYLGEDETAPIRHPQILSGFGIRTMGMRMPPGDTAATIIPSVGCPMGCNFCTTSAFFGGKGKMLNFYETGEELFALMSRMESSMKVRSFFIMDENFLLYKKRAVELLERMKAAGKAWAFYVFSSANAIRKYSIRELVELGISWIWMGLESPRSGYAKLNNADTLQLTRELREHGIKLLGSTIVGLEHHTPENIHDEIEQAVAHETDFHQFMLYTPVPGTPLMRRCWHKGACWMWTWPTFTASTNSTSSTPPFRATTRRRFSTGRSGAISSAMARASTAYAGPRWPDGNGTRIIRMPGSGSASPGKCAP